MATITVPRYRTDDEHRTNAEDVAMVLALVIIAVLGLTILAVVALEFLEILPPRIHTIVTVSVVIFVLVVGRAMLSRVLSLPTALRRDVPVIRHRHY